jgi:hypothetical protein
MKNRAALVGIPVVVAVAILAGLAAANVIQVGKTHPSAAPSVAAPSPSVSAAPASASTAPSPEMTPTSSPVFAVCGPLDESVPLALRVEAFSETGRWWVISMYQDGHVLTPAPLPGQYDDGAWMVARRLTSSGVEQLQTAVRGSGLFDHSASYNAISLPGVTGPEFGGGGYSITVGSGPDAVTVRWTALFPDDEKYFETSPERKALDPLAAHMLAFDSWLTDAAWADHDPCMVQALRFRIFIDAQPNGGSLADLPPDIRDVPWPLGGDILSWGADIGHQPPGEPYHVIRCQIVARRDAFRLVEALRNAGAFDPFTFSTTLDASNYLKLQLGDRAANRIIGIQVQPVLPDDEQCTEANRPYGGGI